MKHVRAKSPCCRGNIIHYGNRRRQCTQCGATWSIRRRKRGRKHRRVSRNLVNQVFSDKRPLGSLAKHYRVSSSGMARRFQRALQRKSRHACLSASLHSRAYILIADGLWFAFKGKKWTLYLRALKPITQNSATFLDPILLLGKENASDWQGAVTAIPGSLKPRLKAFVSDGFRGSKRIAKRSGWIFQRCHFHLISQLQIRRGRRKTTIAGRQTREAICQTTRKILAHKNRSRVKELKNELRGLIRRRDCPRKLKSIVREFLREVRFFRAYLNHPALNLPNTTNTVESMGNLIRSRCGKLRTPESLERWSKAFLKHHPTFTCKRANYQQN